MRLSRTATLCIFGLSSIPISVALARQHHQQQQQPQAQLQQQREQDLQRIHKGQAPLRIMTAADGTPTPIPQDASPAVATSSQPLLLEDTLSSQRTLSIFASLARDDGNSTARFADKQLYTIVLAPTNAALKALEHKPWEDPEEARALGGEAYKGETGMDRAQRNIERFVQRHLATSAITGDEQQEWREGDRWLRGGDGSQAESQAGSSDPTAAQEKCEQVWWETRDGKQVVMPDGIVVEAIVSRVVNGEIWAISGTFES